MAKMMACQRWLSIRAVRSLCMLALMYLPLLAFLVSSSSAQQPNPVDQAAATDVARPASLTLPRIGLIVRQTPGAGVFLEGVTPSSSAAAAGLQSGDYILAVNGKAVKDPVGLVELLHENRNKKVIKLRVWREGTRWTAQLKELTPDDLQAIPLQPQGANLNGDLAGTRGTIDRPADGAVRGDGSDRDAANLRRDVQQLRQELSVMRQRAIDSGQVGYAAPATTGVPTTGLPGQPENTATPRTGGLSQGTTRYGDLGQYYPTLTTGNSHPSTRSPSNRYAAPYPYPGNYSPPFTTFPYYQYYDQYDSSGTRPYYYLTPSGARFGVRIGPYWFDYW